MGKLGERVKGGLGSFFEKVASQFIVQGQGGNMIPVEEALPATVEANPITFFDSGPMDGLIKGTKSEEYWYNPIFGRPRDIDFRTLEFLEKSEWVQICTNTIIDAITGAEWCIVPRKKGVEIPPERLDAIKDLFENLPRQEESFEDCLAAMLPDRLWYDAGTIIKIFPKMYWSSEGTLELPKDEYPVVDLSARDGRTFMIETLPVGGVWKKFWQYSWINPNGLPTCFFTEEILYFRKRPSSRNTYGTSTLEIIQDTINYLMDSTEATSKFFENGLFVGGQIDHPDIKNPKLLIKKAREYKAQLQGPKKMNKWLVTGGGVNVKTFPFNPQQMQWLDGQKWFAKIVMAAFNITPSEIGFTEDLNRATGIQQMTIHKSRAIRPELNLIERVLNRGLIWKIDSEVSFAYKEQLDLEDQMKQAQVDQIYTTIGKTTIAELRERDGQEPLEDDIYSQPFAEQAIQAQNQSNQSDEPDQPYDESLMDNWNAFDSEEGDEVFGEDTEKYMKVWSEEARKKAAEARHRKRKVQTEEPKKLKTKKEEEIPSKRKGKAESTKKTKPRKKEDIHLPIFDTKKRPPDSNAWGDMSSAERNPLLDRADEESKHVPSMTMKDVEQYVKEHNLKKNKDIIAWEEQGEETGEDVTEHVLRNWKILIEKDIKDRIEDEYREKMGYPSVAEANEAMKQWIAEAAEIDKETKEIESNTPIKFDEKKLGTADRKGLEKMAQKIYKMDNEMFGVFESWFAGGIGDEGLRRLDAMITDTFSLNPKGVRSSSLVGKTTERQKSIIQALSKISQKYNELDGSDTVTAYRGISYEHGGGQYDLRNVTSWSTDDEIANRFATEFANRGDKGTVLKAEIPIKDIVLDSRILGTKTEHFDEAELLVKGGKSIETEKVEGSEVKKALNTEALSGEGGYTPIPMVVDGHVDSGKLEDEAIKRLKNFWGDIEEELIVGVKKEEKGEISKGGVGSGIKGHTTAEKKEFEELRSRYTSSNHYYMTPEERLELFEKNGISKESFDEMNKILDAYGGTKTQQEAAVKKISSALKENSPLGKAFKFQISLETNLAKHIPEDTKKILKRKLDDIEEKKESKYYYDNDDYELAKKYAINDYERDYLTLYRKGKVGDRLIESWTPNKEGVGAHSKGSQYEGEEEEESHGWKPDKKMKIVDLFKEYYVLGGMTRGMGSADENEITLIRKDKLKEVLST